MYGYNNLILIGTCTQAPRLKYDREKTPVCRFLLVTDEPVQRNGEWCKKRRTHIIIAKRALGEQCNDNVVMGASYIVTGSLDYIIDFTKRRLAVCDAKQVQPLQSVYYQPGMDDYGRRIVVQTPSVPSEATQDQTPTDTTTNIPK